MKILKGEQSEESVAGEETKPMPCRFLDLQHTAVSRMLIAGVPFAKVVKIIGWSASTMVLMAKRYVTSL